MPRTTSHTDVGGVAAVGERDRGAAGEPAVPVQVQVAGDAGPHEIDDGAAAVVGVHARAAGLDEQVAQSARPAEVELAVGVEPADRGRPVRRQHPVGADDLARTGPRG